MNDENLLPPFKKGSKRAREAGRKGGLALKNNPNARIAAKLRCLRQKGLTDDTAKRIYELMTDSHMHDLDILLYLESMKNSAKTVREKNAVSRTIIDFRKMRHGSADSANTQINVQNNIVNIDMDELKEIIKNIK